MFANKLAASALTVLLVASALGPAATAATSNQQQAYAGTHVSFDTTSNAIVDYAVDGETIMESVSVQSKSKAQNQGGISVGTDLSAVTNFAGADLSLDAKSETSATVTTDSGAQLDAHDNSRGILVIRSGEESQYVAINISASSRAESESDRRVVVTTEDGTKGTFILVGDGEVAVNDRGNVTAELASDSKLVFRSYTEDRDEEDKRQEQLIADGHAAAEVYVMQKSEGGSETVADVVRYSEDTSVEVTQQSEGTVKMTAERSEHQGKVIITSVSDAVINSADDLNVTVDGEAAVRASSYSDLRSAIGSDTSKFLVRQQSSAQGSADVLVAVNHFSERQITMTEEDVSDADGGETTTTSDSSSDADGETTTGADGADGSGGDGSDGDSTSTTLPGFDIGVALVALVAVALFALRRR